MHMRGARQARARGLAAALLVCSLIGGCTQPPQAGDSTLIGAWDIAPAPPSAGPDSIVRFTLRDKDGQPIPGASLQLQGHMSHPGMAPVISPATSVGDGVYEAHLRFTMAGDWVLVVEGQLPDGSRLLRRQLEVPGVRGTATAHDH